MRLTFYGATQKVTGSMFLLELEDEYTILIDCGSDLEGKNKEYKYGNFPFDASLVNTVFLTHSHIDHSGQIPNLYQDGFEGQVLCTAATLDLAEILLYDSASINARQVKKIEGSHKKSKKWKGIETKGLYLNKQVESSIANFVPIAFNLRFQFKDQGFVTFYPAGHLLGAAFIVVEIFENNQWIKLGFSGDVGRDDFPLLVNPATMPEVDYLIMESTYGDRLHTDKLQPEVLLKTIVEECCVEKTGRLIIPSFSVGRTQAMLYTLNRLYQNHDIKPIKVFTDSPMAKESTKIYEKYRKLLNKEAQEFYAETDSLFDFENLFYLESNEASKAVSNHSEPCIIISSSGMIKGGRIEHHIEKNIENPYSTILLIGYATDESIGGKLLNKEIKQITVNHKRLDVRAQVKKIDVFSGHGDLNDLLKFVESQNIEKLKKLFLVHGESNSMCNFKSELEKKGFENIEMPEFGQTFEITTI